MKFYGEGVEQPESKLVVVPAPVNWIAAHIRRGVVRPNHVHLKPGTEASAACGLRHAGPRGRIPRQSSRCRERPSSTALVHGLQEAHGVAVFVTTLRRSAASRPAVSNNRDEALRRRHRRAGRRYGSGRASKARSRSGCLQLRAGRMTGIRGVPVGVEAPARVGMLIGRRTVGIGKAVLVSWEVRGNPIEDHPEPGAMRPVDEPLEAGRIAEAAARRERSDRLIAQDASSGCSEIGSSSR